MMATVGPLNSSSVLPLLESLEDNTAEQSEQTDAYLTIANRLSGEEGRHCLPAIETHFTRLAKTILVHITNPNAELSQAALQALGFCVYHVKVVSGVPEILSAEILSSLCSLVVKSADKNTCTRALWVISKQNFSPEVVAKKVPSILSTLETVWTRDDIQSVVMEHEALNVVIRLLEQVPSQIGDCGVRLAKLVIPLVVHSATKVRLRAAAAMEMALPYLLEKQTEVAAVIEPIMSTKLIPELQKLFMSKNEANVLKLWPLFVRLLGKLLHRGGPFINSLLHLEELGFRNSSPTIKKIAFIAWKSLIDNFALNSDILCSAKRMKLLMQPLSSIQVRTEALLLTKLEVWWYLVVRLGPHLAPNFEQVSVPLLQCTISCDSSTLASTPTRGGTPNAACQKTGLTSFSSPSMTPRMNLNNSPVITPRLNLSTSLHPRHTFPSIQLLGLEMLLHYFLGPEVVAVTAKNNLQLTLEPLTHPFLSGVPPFTKHAALLISAVRDGFIAIGKEAPDSLLALIWKSLVSFVSSTIEFVGSKKERPGCEVLTLMLQALRSIVLTEVLSVDKVLVLFQTTVNGIPQKVLGSASYQVGKMDVLNGTPALFLILLFYDTLMLSDYIEDERFFKCLNTLVSCGLTGHTSPLAFGEAVLGAISRSAGSLGSKEQLWRMWNAVVTPLTETITQSNEVNQGDALEHNFSSVHCALMIPIAHLLPGTPMHQVARKSMLITWSKLYKVFARCSALVVTAEENVCCEELSAKMAVALDRETLSIPSTQDVVASILQDMVECVDFSPYTPQFQQKMTSPHTPLNWKRKKSKALGNLSAYQSLLVRFMEAFLATEGPEAISESTGLSIVSILSTLFTNLTLPTAVQEALGSLIQPLTLFYKAASVPQNLSSLFLSKLEKLLGEIFGCLQTRSTLSYNELLVLLSPLLCVLLPHNIKQLRILVTQFWNATFANAVSLAYPDDLRQLLSQVKQKTPIILPGFEAVSVPDVVCGQDSNESSQLETKLSGLAVSSVAIKDSPPGRVVEPKDRSSKAISKTISTKLEFGSLKPPRREILEEEASIDFVFIPPETKGRVLTEHQKEVKRNKRVDIPLMYNNLDASLDTFSQYTRSQEDSMDSLSMEHSDTISKELSCKVQEDVETEILKEKTKVYTSPKVTGDEKRVGNLESANNPIESQFYNTEAGTPQKPNSRRQSFITLEKYADGKTASPINVKEFTGPLMKTPNSQENTSSEIVESPKGLKMKTNCSMNVLPESSRQTKEFSKEAEPGDKLGCRLPSEETEDEEDVIPDTQTITEVKNIIRETPRAEQSQTYHQGDESEGNLKDSPSPLPQTSPEQEPRRSGRKRFRSFRVDSEEQEKYNQRKKRQPGDESKCSQILNVIESPLQGRTRRRVKEGAKVIRGDVSMDSLRTRVQKDDSSKTNSQLDSQSDNETQVRRSMRRKSSVETEDSIERKRGRPPKEVSNQNKVEMRSRSENRSPKMDKRSKLVTNSEEPILLQKTKKVKDEVGSSKYNSQNTPPTSQTESQGLKSMRGNLLNQSDDLVVVKFNRGTCKDDSLSQNVSEVLTSSPLNSQLQGSSSPASKMSEVAENHCNDSADNEYGTGSINMAVGQTENCRGSRVRKSEGAEELSESENSLGITPENLQSINRDVPAKSIQSCCRLSRHRSSQAVDMDASESASSENRDASSQKTMVRNLKVVAFPKPLACEVEEWEAQDPSKNSPQWSKNTGHKNTTNSPVKTEHENLKELFKVETEQLKEGQPKLNTDYTSLQNPENIDSDTMRTKGLQELPCDSPVPPIVKDSTISLEPLNLFFPPGISGSSVYTLTTSEQTQNPGLHVSDSSVEKVLAQTVEVAIKTPQVNPVSSSYESPSVSEEKVLAQTVEVAIEAPQVDPVSSSYESPSVSEDKDKDFTSNIDGQTDFQDFVEEKVQENPSNLQEGEENDGLAMECDRAEEIKIAIVKDSVNSVNHNCSASDQPEVDLPDTRPCPAKQNGLDSLTGLQIDDSKISILDKDSVNNVTDFCNSSRLPETPSKGVYQDSPAKQRSLEALTMTDVCQSPINSRTKGSWSPSASPSTSILKKGQKRALEEDTLCKSRHVSFADPIQHQELADDIDRRSPVIRTSSPKRTKITAAILQPKITEMSQEPQTFPKDCVYPALVSCSTPVEAVLPQITSNMWPRGFGQLVRARNIKTVGDLSALTPSEIKTLPIRSPKISNVKKALKTYHEQQRKCRGADELKSFDEMEKMTSDLEEMNASQNQEDDKSSAQELVDETVSTDDRPLQDNNCSQMPVGGRKEQLKHIVLLEQVETLTSRTATGELKYCSSEQLVELHSHLGDMMKSVVVELQARLCQMDGKLY